MSARNRVVSAIKRAYSSFVLPTRILVHDLHLASLAAVGPKVVSEFALIVIPRIVMAEKHGEIHRA